MQQECPNKEGLEPKGQKEMKRKEQEKLKNQKATRSSREVQEKPEETKATGERQEKIGKGKSEKVEQEPGADQSELDGQEKVAWMQVAKAAKGKGKSEEKAAEIANQEIARRRSHDENRLRKINGMFFKADTVEQKKTRCQAEKMIIEGCKDRSKIDEVFNELMQKGPQDLSLIQRLTEPVRRELDEDEVSETSEEEAGEDTGGNRGGENRGLLGRFTPWRK